jgi:hypothetical protein
MLTPRIARPRRRVARHRPARRAESGAAEPAPRAARRLAARGLVQGLRGNLLRVNAGLLHRPQQEIFYAYSCAGSYLFTSWRNTPAPR